jgi:hypothetical protein
MPPRVIPVPKTPKASYNPERPASGLLRAQVTHLREALRWHAAEVQALLAMNPNVLRTERDVSDYCQKVSRALHPHAAKGPKP